MWLTGLLPHNRLLHMNAEAVMLYTPLFGPLSEGANVLALPALQVRLLVAKRWDGQTKVAMVLTVPMQVIEPVLSIAKVCWLYGQAV